MKFECWIKAEYEIPDGELRAVAETLKANWAPEVPELFPHDLINTARNMGVGKLVFNRMDPDVETDEPALQESEIPEPSKKKGRKR